MLLTSETTPLHSLPALSKSDPQRQSWKALVHDPRSRIDIFSVEVPWHHRRLGARVGSGGSTSGRSKGLIGRPDRAVIVR